MHMRVISNAPCVIDKAAVSLDFFALADLAFDSWQLRELGSHEERCHNGLVTVVDL